MSTPVKTRAIINVEKVNAGCGDLDQRLAGCRPGIVHVFVAENIRRPGFVDPHSFHELGLLSCRESR